MSSLLTTVRHEATHGLSRAVSEWKSIGERRRKRREFHRWLDSLGSNPPDVLLGANINANDGIRHHLLGIVRHSGLSISLAPPDELRDRLTYTDFHTTFRQEFLDFAPTGIACVHSHVYPYYIDWCMAHRESGVRWVHTYHSPYFEEMPGRALEPWQNEINRALIDHARFAHVRISVALWQQAWLRDTHRIETVYIPNGVDVDVCDRGNAGRFTEKFGASQFVLFVGRTDAVKNPVEFVRLAKRVPEQRFVMIGRGLNANWLRDEHGVEAPANLLFAGEITRDEVQDAIAASSVVVLTSVWEGLPTVALEAMTHGKGVVVPDDYGCVEAVGGGESGFVYRRGDLDDLVSKTVSALDDTEKRARARDRVLTEYDWRVVAPQLDAIYRGGLVR